jgi:ribosomal protein S2
MSSFSQIYSIFKSFKNWPIQLGAQSQETKPAMKKYISGSYNSIEIIDPQKSIYHLLLAKKIIEESYKQGGTILFFTNQPGFLKILQSFFPNDDKQLILLDTKWIPGLLTNWSEFSRGLRFFESREFFAHQRKTFIRLQKRYKPFLQNQESSQLKTPDLLVCFDANESVGALNEAFHLKIPSIAIANTNTNLQPSKISFLIPGNTKSFKALYFFSRILLASFCKSPETIKTQAKEN